MTDLQFGRGGRVIYRPSVLGWRPHWSAGRKTSGVKHKATNPRRDRRPKGWQIKLLAFFFFFFLLIRWLSLWEITWRSLLSLTVCVSPDRLSLTHFSLPPHQPAHCPATVMLLRLPAAVRWFTVSLSPSFSLSPYFSLSLFLSLSLSLCVLLTDSFMDSELGPNANPGIHIGAVFSSCSPVKMDMAEAASAEGKCEGRGVSFCFCPCVCVGVCVLFPQSHTHTHTHTHTFTFNSTCRCYSEKTNCTCPRESQWLKMQIRPGTHRGTHKCFSS